MHFLSMLFGFLFLKDWLSLANLDAFQRLPVLEQLQLLMESIVSLLFVHPMEMNE